MNFTITPYKGSSKASNIIAVIAIVVVIVVRLMNHKVDSGFLFPLFIILMMPLLMFLVDRMNRKRSVTITDSELLCEKTAKKCYTIKWMDTLVIKRKDIVYKEIQYGSKGSSSLVVNTNEDSYRIGYIDPEAIVLAMDGSLQEASNHIEKKAKRTKAIVIIGSVVVDIMGVFLSLL